MEKNQPASAWGDKRAKGYDERAEKFIDGYLEIHAIVLEHVRSRVPVNGRLLVIGAGTGRECFAVKTARPDIQIVAVEPSGGMLAKAREKLDGFENVTLIESAFSGALELGEFDAATAVLVAHFLPKEKRLDFLGAAVRHLKPGGFYLSADLFLPVSEISLDDAVTEWADRLRTQGDTEEVIEKELARMREAVHFISQEEYEKWLRGLGLEAVERIFQGHLTAAFTATKLA